MLRIAACLLLALPCVMMAPAVSTLANMKVLDGNFTLYWEANSTYIMFEAVVKTHGYVGFGISEAGLMFPGDAVIGWVDHNNVEFADYHLNRHGPAVKDASQDWTLYSSSENNADGTVLRFGRPLNTHDDNDLVIHPGMNHVIYSYTETDPTDGVPTYHGHVNRGSVEIDLLGSKVPVGK